MYAYWITVNYREAYGLFACNGILFNHESPLRGENFVTRKISRAVAAIEAGLQDRLSLGNMDAKRDWGHARDYVKGMWLMLQQDEPRDFVLATGVACSVREFVEAAFGEIDIELRWEGTGTEEVGRHARTGRILVDVDPQFYRPAEVNHLLGDPTLAHQVLGWQHLTNFEQLVQEMVAADRKALRDGSTEADA